MAAATMFLERMDSSAAAVADASAKYYLVAVLSCSCFGAWLKGLELGTQTQHEALRESQD
jgi:hypothetical protein